MPTTELLKVKDIMEIYKIGKRTVSNWIEKGMPVIKKGRIIRFDRNKVWEWFNNENK